MASKVEINNLINEAITNYPMAKVDHSNVVTLWFRMFHAIPIEMLIVALAKHMTESEFFPSVASIFKFIDVTYDEHEGWEQAEMYASDMRCYNDPGMGLSVSPQISRVRTPTDPVVIETLKFVTWKDIAFSSSQNLPFVRKDFIGRYKQVAKELNVKRRGQLIAGNINVLNAVGGVSDAERRRREIIEGGQPKEILASQTATEVPDVYDDVVDAKILSGAKIVDANEIL
jgi:hypothetical protein